MTFNRFAILDAMERMLIANPEVSLPAISETLDIERHSIEKTVRGMIGPSFRSWRRELLMPRAAEMLVSSNTSVKGLAIDFGYASPQAFSRAFRAFFGISPIGYRQRHSKVTKASTNDNQSLLPRPPRRANYRHEKNPALKQRKTASFKKHR